MLIFLLFSYKSLEESVKNCSKDATISVRICPLGRKTWFCTSGVTRGGHARAPLGFARSPGEKNLVITIIYTIFDAFFQKSWGTARAPSVSGYTTTLYINQQALQDEIGFAPI
jgi:hypothetical protein